MTRPAPTVRAPRPRRGRGALALLAVLACLGAAPAPEPATPPGSLDALAGRPSNRFT